MSINRFFDKSKIFYIFFMSIQHLRSAGSFVSCGSFQDHIQRFEVNDNPQLILNSSVVEAFGRGKCPKVVRLLTHRKEDVVQKALLTLTSILKFPQDVAMCVKCGILVHLEKYLMNSTPTLRSLSAKCIELIALTANGKRALLDGNTPSRIHESLHDKQIDVRYHITTALIQCSSTTNDATVLTSSDYIPIVVRRLQIEPRGNLQVLVLRLLKNCVCDTNTDSLKQAYDAGAVDAIFPLIASPLPIVREAACAALESICFLSSARYDAVEKTAVVKLVHLLMDDCWQVVSAAAGALMALSIQDNTKRQLVDTDGISYFGPLLMSSKWIVQLKILKLIAIVAPYPPARHVLRVPSILASLRALSKDTDAIIAKSAKITLGILCPPTKSFIVSK